MKKYILLVFCALSALTLSAEEKKGKVEVHGFIRNFYVYDTRECLAGTEDFFSYVPKDILENGDREDLNSNSSFKTSALTSRVWVEACGYEYNGWDLGARIEADFYSGLTKTDNDPLTTSALTGTAVLRMRQAYVSISNYRWKCLFGQTWHPLAVDMPHIFSLNTGSPFNPFSRTPQISIDAKLNNQFSLSFATLWQQQYTSAGPYGSSANYMRNGGYEFYLGANYKQGGFLARLGANVLSLTPRLIDVEKKKVLENCLFLTPFLYLQYSDKDFSVKFKSVLAQGGEHLNLNGGYGVSGIQGDGRSYFYSPTVNSSSWISMKYALGKLDFILFGGYAKNFGTSHALLQGVDGKALGYYFSKNSLDNFNSMWRVTPELVYNMGKLQFGLEYECTSAQYGDKSKGMNFDCGLYDKGLHWVTNHRLQALVKFTF